MLEFSADGESLYSSSADQTARIWDVKSLAARSVLKGHRDELYSLSPAPGDRRLVTGCKDGTIFVWSTKTKEVSGFYRRRSLSRQRYFCSPDGRHLFVPDREGRIMKVNPLTLEDAGLMPEVGTNNWVSFLADNLAALGSEASGTRVLNLETGQVMKEVPGYFAPFDSSSELLFTIQSDPWQIAIWNSQTWEVVKTMPAVRNLTRITVAPDWSLAAFAPLGKPGHVEIARLGGEVGPENQVEFKAHNRELSGLAFSPDTRLLGTSSQSGYAYLWNPADGSRVAELRGHANSINDLAFSPDSRRVLTCGSEGDAVKLWDARSYQEVLTLAAPGSLFRSPRLLTDERTLIATSWDINQPHLHVWRAPTWEEIEIAETHRKQRRERER
jgi:WD40 repeat protein